MRISKMTKQNIRTRITVIVWNDCEKFMRCPFPRKVFVFFLRNYIPKWILLLVWSEMKIVYFYFHTVNFHGFLAASLYDCVPFFRRYQTLSYLLHFGWITCCLFVNHDKNRFLGLIVTNVWCHLHQTFMWVN